MAFVCDLKWRKHRRSKLEYTVVDTGANLATGQFSSPSTILALADHTTPTLPIKILVICPCLYSQSLTEPFASHTNSTYLRFHT